MKLDNLNREQRIRVGRSLYIRRARLTDFAIRQIAREMNRKGNSK